MAHHRSEKNEIRRVTMQAGVTVPIVSRYIASLGEPVRERSLRVSFPLALMWLRLTSSAPPWCP